MSAAIALLMTGVLLIAIARRRKTEDGAAHILGAGFVCLLFAILLFFIQPARAQTEQPGETYVAIKLEVVQQIAAKLEAQAGEIERLRALLKKASTPKECI